MMGADDKNICVLSSVQIGVHLCLIVHNIATEN